MGKATGGQKNTTCFQECCADHGENKRVCLAIITQLGLGQIVLLTLRCLICTAAKFSVQ